MKEMKLKKDHKAPSVGKKIGMDKAKEGYAKVNAQGYSVEQPSIICTKKGFIGDSNKKR